MCGIIARIGLKDTNFNSVLNGLNELEYRGYDSYGLLLYSIRDKKNHLFKEVGTLSYKEKKRILNFKSNLEIGHTRWATTGEVSDSNAHPHFDNKEKFFIVMNGIVENYIQIRDKLKNLGYIFLSQTDTEVIPHLYSYYYQDIEDTRNHQIHEYQTFSDAHEKIISGQSEQSSDSIKLNLIEATKKVIKELSGEFSFLLKYENYVLGYKNINPIIVGVNEEEIFISSDSNLVQKNSNNYFILEDNEFFIASINDINFNLDFYDKNFNLISKPSHISKSEIKSYNKVTKYYMQKEILDQKSLINFITKDNLESINYFIENIKNKKVIISGAGTSYHAAIFLHYTLLKLGVLSQLVLASELNNYSSLIKDSLIVVFSQSGETADLIYPLRELKNNNEIFTITNTTNSTLDRFAKRSIYLNCEKEVAVASTKAFTFQMFFSKVIEALVNNNDLETQISEYEGIFDTILIKNEETLNNICKDYHKSKSFFFIGRNEYYPLALEGALKLKEISYIHAEGFAGGELKHGSLALIQKGVPVVVIGDGSEIISNAIEIKTRGGIIIGINENNNEVYDYYLEVPIEYKEIFTTILMQILSLKMALILGYNPDKPRNLAKSVTVK